MKKYYSYSVKDELVKLFPSDTITEMRAHKEHYDENDIKDLIPLAWTFIDSDVIGHFLSDYFLEDTILCDDYIAYIAQHNSQKYVFLAFLHFEDNIPFDLSPEYAYNLCKEWKSQGYETVVMRNCIGINKWGDGNWNFVTHSYSEAGTGFLLPVQVNDQYIFVQETTPFWNHAAALFYSAINSGLLSEYESLFKDDVFIGKCSYRSEYDVANDKYGNIETIVSGIENIKSYFENGLLPKLACVKGNKSCCFDIRLVFEHKMYTLFVDRSNQISQIIEEPINDTDIVIPIPFEQLPKEVIRPSITEVCSLDIQTMHAYAIQIIFSDGCVKNYYLHSFYEKEIPDSIIVEGNIFDEAVLNSVEYINDIYKDGVVFSNGYYIPSHILYYRGVAQLVPEKINDVIIENDNIRISGLYRVPLKVGGILHQTCVPRDDAYYGVNATLLDKEGNRLTDYSGFYIDNNRENTEVYTTQSESNYKIGYLRNDGKWLIPPIFDSAKYYNRDHCVTAKIGEHQYLVNKYGDMIPFDYDIDTDCFHKLCEFSTGKFDGNITFPEEDYFEELSPGSWGFIDERGEIVIEPQYVFTSGFGFIENRAFVAKIISGNTLWGLIDEKGNEIIPCIYPNLATHHGTAINFQREINGNYGIMDFDGNIIMEPRYRYIYEYNEEHNWIVAGDEWDEFGVANINDGKIIVPFEYDYICFEDNYIECETCFGVSVYYDYDGQKLPDDNYYRWEHNGNYGMWKDHKCGLVDKEGKVIVPFIFNEYKHISYYEKGYIVTGIKSKYGLSKLDGTILLEEKYTDITIDDGFIIASLRTQANWSVRDEIFYMDGTPVFKDIYRRVNIHNGELTRETPFGIEHYRVECKNN